MEQSKIFSFLVKLNLVDDDNWNKYFSKYCDFKFSRNKITGLINIKILINQILPPDILFGFIENLELVDKTVSFNIEYNYQNFLMDDVIKYLIFFTRKFLNNKTNKKDCENLINILEYNLKINKPIIENNTICINYLEKKQFDCINKYLEKLNFFIKQHGFNNYELICMEDKKILNTIIEHKKNINEKIKEKTTIKQPQSTDSSLSYKFKKNISGEITKLSDLFVEMKMANVEGEIFKIETILTKNGFQIFKFYITDYTDSILLKVLFGKKVNQAVLDKLKIGTWIKAKISIQTDLYENSEITGLIEEVTVIEKPKKFKRSDDEKIKRIELINHTNMTAFEGLINIEEVFSFSKKMGYKAVAITDKFNCQNFPEFYNESKKYPEIKPIYGVQLDKTNKEIVVVKNSNNVNLNDACYVVLDIETTGLSPYYDKIIEFGAIKYYKGTIIDRVQFFINPEQEINEKIYSLTRISNNELDGAIKIGEALIKIKEFVKDCVLIAHNGIKFDFPFLNCKLEQENMELLTNPVIDTLQISRAVNEQISGHSLGIIARKYKINYNELEAHRADKDAEYLLEVWKKMVDILDFKGVKTIDDLNSKLQNNFLKSRNRGNLITVYCKSQEEIKKLYELVSISLTENYYGGPKVYLENFSKFQNSFLITNSATEGDVFEAAMNSTNKELDEIIKNNYDFITIASPFCFLHEIERGVYKKEWIENAIKRIIDISKKYNKKVVATSDTYYLNEIDEIYFRVYVNAKIIGGKRHRLFKYNDSNLVLPKFHFRTTSELKKEFAFLNDEKLINEIVVENTNYIENLIEKNIKPIKENLHSPYIEGASDKLKKLIYERAYHFFGKQINDLVKARIDREINSIIDNGYAIVYWFSHLLVNQSIKDGYLVGSRGSVGSSITAWLINITEVNPLEPHYICKNCFYFNFVKNVESGFDLPEINCPNCGLKIFGNGHNIPFETFMGFKGDKIPDIDLNFSALYQTKAHEFIRNMFGKERVFRAGTINTIAEKTAYGYVKTYFEENNKENVRNAEILRIAKKCENVKRTTGQHPGGIVVIPHENNVYDFTPFNYPADDTSQDWYTTHLAFESLHDSLLKFDILGHDNPTILKFLSEWTKINPDDIPNHDEKVMDLFNSTNSLNIKNPSVNKILKVGSSGIPEFGTNFVKEMLLITKPKKFSDLIRISGLAHGTNVWNDNAKYLIEEKGLKISDVISCRDDIMSYLISKGIESSTAFKIMEDVRKGKGLKDDYIKVLNDNKIPDWYIDSCNKISYLFPKAHATAYVIMAWKIAWFKIHYPLYFYASYFSIRIDVFDIKTILRGQDELISKINSTKEKLLNPKTKKLVKNKEIDLIPIYELALELLARGFEFSPIDLKKSQATDFLVEGNKLIPPFSAIDGLGETVANSIVKAREEKMFTSKEDIKKRTKITTAHLKSLIDLEIISSLDDDDQISLFNYN